MARSISAPKRKREGQSRWGVELRILWGERILAEHFLHAGEPRRFSLGADKGVDFATGTEALGGDARFDVVEATAESFFLRFTEAMEGGIVRDGNLVSLRDAALDDEDGIYSVEIRPGDAGFVQVGPLRLEVTARRAPRPVVMPFEDSVDFTFLSVALVVLFVVAGFVITAMNRDTEGSWTDDLTFDRARMVKVLLQAPKKAAENPILEKLRAEKKVAQAAPAAKHEAGKLGRAEGKDKPGKSHLPQSSRANAQRLAAAIFKGAGGVFGPDRNLGLTAALSDVRSAEFGDARGIGLTLKGDKNGGGGDAERAQIGAIGAKGRSNGLNDYGENAGELCCKKDGPVIQIDRTDFELTGSLDKELIRQVIHQHRSQIRYCYEERLQQKPTLGGKVTVKFVIGEAGSVIASEIGQSTAHDAALESCITSRVRGWLFPKPKGGGKVSVSYPFVLTQGG